MTKKLSEPKELPKLSRPRAKSAETRSRIIRGAIETLETHGIGEATTRKIAAGAKVQLANLHYHFASKEALLLAVLEVLIDDMSVKYQAEIRNFGDLDSRVEQLIRSIWRNAEATRNTQIAQIELTLYALRTQGSEWLAAKQYEAYIDFYRKLLVDSNSVPDGDVDRISLILGRFILSGIDGLMLQSFALDDKAATDAGLEMLIDSSRDMLARLTKSNGS